MSHPVIERRPAERNEAIATARGWAAELAGLMDLTAVVVVGSVARGDFNKWSDLDVLVLADDLPPGGRARLDLLHDGAPVSLQPIGWTPGEFLERHRRRDPIAVEALAVGVGVYGVLPVAAATS